MPAALGQPEEKSPPAFSLRDEPCTEMNLAEVRIVNLAQIIQHGPKDNDTRAVYLLTVL